MWKNELMKLLIGVEAGRVLTPHLDKLEEKTHEVIETIKEEIQQDDSTQPDQPTETPPYSLDFADITDTDVDYDDLDDYDGNDFLGIS